jgi:tRNA threonylcarbamoyl adenosine modification protein YeaZ
MNLPIGLAIHTSSPDLGLALGSPDDIHHEVWDLGREMTTYLHEKLAEFITPQSFQTLNLDFIAVAKGPGSFTGTRMGMTVARTLSQQLQIPLFGISSLGAIAAAQPINPAPIAIQPIAVQLAAQRGEFHIGIYDDPFDWEKNCDRVISGEAWQSEQALQTLGQITIQAPTNQGEFVKTLLTIAHHAYQKGDRPQWWSTTPTYGQHPVVNS